MNVFTDFHHASLLNSLIMLFEGRMGGNVFRPIGTYWHEKGYWKVFDHPATVAQYLGINGATPDDSPKLNEVIRKGSLLSEGGALEGVYHCNDISSGGYNKAFTFSAFMATEIDIVIASIPQHIEPFRRLCNEHPSKPKLIFQVGNQWNLSQYQASMLDGVMASARIPTHGELLARNGEPLPIIEYHQEFDLEHFRFVPPQLYMPKDCVYSFVNCFGTDDLFRGDYGLFERVEKFMPNWAFAAYGGACRDGSVSGSERLGEAMRAAKFTWHTKQGGDGYGHILHNSLAVGRPLIFKKQYYLGKLAEPYLKDEKTGIQIDGLSETEIVNKIEHWGEPENYTKLSNTTYKNFIDYVNFDVDASEIGTFIKNLLQ